MKSVSAATSCSTLPANGGNPTGWQQFTVTVTADGPSSVLAFTGTGAQDEHGIFIDNVGLTASAILDDEDTSRNPAVEIQGGPGDDGAGVVATGTINFDAGKDTLDRIEVTGDVAVNGVAVLALQVVFVDANGVGTPEPLTIQTWTPDGLGGGTMTWGSANIPVALTLQVSANGDYTFTQYAPLAHPVAGTEDNLALSFGFVVIDQDGDSAPGSITVIVDDDTPVASDETVVSNEGQTVTGVLDFVGGADGAGVTHISGTALTFGLDGWSQYVTGPQGSLRVMANGNYQFVAQSEDPYVDGGTAQFTFTVTDGDGDPSHALVNVTVNDTIQTNFVILDDVEVLENETFVYTAHLDYATWTPLTVTLSNGVVINFAAGQLNCIVGAASRAGRRCVRGRRGDPGFDRQHFREQL